MTEHRNMVVVERYTDKTHAEMMTREIYRFAREVVTMYPDVFSSSESVRHFIVRGRDQTNGSRLKMERQRFKIYRQRYPKDMVTTGAVLLKVPKRTRRKRVSNEPRP